MYTQQSLDSRFVANFLAGKSVYVSHKDESSKNHNTDKAPQ